jgi:hypothetical protein
MRSLGKGVMPATTQVKVLSPEITPCRTGSRVSYPGSQYRYAHHGECVSGVPGSKSVAGERTVCIGTWENRSAPYGSPREAEKAGRGYGAVVVGLTRIRGVGRVTPAEGTSPLEGVSVLTQRDKHLSMPDTEAGKTLSKLSLISSHACGKYGLQFTCLTHLLNAEFMRDCYNSLNRNKAVGIDGNTSSPVW